MFYKVVIAGVTVELTKKRDQAVAAFKESGAKDKQIWQVGHRVAKRYM